MWLHNCSSPGHPGAARVLLPSEPVLGPAIRAPTAIKKKNLHVHHACCSVPTIDGTAEVTIKPGTQPGDKLRMRGYGVRMDAADRPGRRGDQYVRVVVKVPRSLTAEQRRLLEEYRAAGKGGSRRSSGRSGSSTSSGPSSSGGSGGSARSSGGSTSGGSASASSHSASGSNPGSSGGSSSSSSGGGATQGSTDTSGEAGKEGGSTDSGSSGKRSWRSWFSSS